MMLINFFFKEDCSSPRVMRANRMNTIQSGGKDDNQLESQGQFHNRGNL